MSRRFSVFVLFAAAAFAGAETHVVATNGSDAAAGTLAVPWRTVQHAARVARPGDVVEVRGGVYHELVQVLVSGSPGAGPIVFESHPGELAVMDGTGLRASMGQTALFDVLDRSYVTIQGFELRNFTSSTTAQVPMGIFVHGAGTHLQILNNHVHDITTTAAANAENCASNAHGIAVYGTRAPEALEDVTIAGNEVDHLKTGCSESVALNGNVTHFVVRGNRIHDNDNIGIDAIGFEKKAPDEAYDQARDGLISENRVWNITSYGNPDYGNVYAANGIYVDGGTRILIERNVVHDTDINIELASEHAGRVTSLITLRENLIYNGNANGISIGGYDAKRGGTLHCTIERNVLRNNDTKHTGGGEFQIQYYANGNVFKGNTIEAGTAKFFLHSYVKQAAIPAALDSNFYSLLDGVDGGLWMWMGTNHQGFMAYRVASGQDAHGAFVP